MNSSHKHDHSSTKSVLEVDEDNRLLFVDGKKYQWGYERTADWTGISQHRTCWLRLHRKGEAEEIDSTRKIKRLNRQLKRALEEHEATQDAKLQAALALEGSVQPESASVSESDSAPQRKPTRNKSWKQHTSKPADGQRIERTKYGVRVWTVDGKTWWDICVNESINYPGGTAVRLTLPPPRKDGKRWNMAIFDLGNL